MTDKAVQRTLAIIKPDAIEKKAAGKIIDAIEQEGFTIRGIKTLCLTAKDAGKFYAVHEGKPFYEGLVNFMSSGRIIAIVLEADDAIARWRKLMGPTDSRNAPEGTLRNRFGTDVRLNACHGSDAPETAQQEISFFFSEYELL